MKNNVVEAETLKIEVQTILVATNTNLKTDIEMDLG